MKITVTEEMREALRGLDAAKEAKRNVGLSCTRLHEAKQRIARAEWELGRLVAQAVEEAPACDPRHDAYWVTVHMGTGRLHCERCGVTVRVKLPCLIQDFRVHLWGFVKEHARCVREEAPHA